MKAEIRILDVLSPEGFPTVQVKLVPIPWCTAHDRQAVIQEFGLPPDECWQVVWANELGVEYDLCRISVGGPDHEWWKIT